MIHKAKFDEPACQPGQRVAQRSEHSRRLGHKAEPTVMLDQQGRDILSRMIYGARISFSISMSAVVLGAVIGTFLGLVAGSKGRLVGVSPVLLTFTAGPPRSVSFAWTPPTTAATGVYVVKIGTRGVRGARSCTPTQASCAAWRSG